MAAKQQRDQTDVDPIHILTKLVELEVRLQPIIIAVQKLEDTNEGTLRTMGLKEKMAVVQQDIELNKASFLKLEAEFKRLEIQIQDTLKAMSVNIITQFEEKVQIVLNAQKVSDADALATRTALQKIQPWINVIAWAAVTAGGIIVGLVLSGQWYLGPHP